MPRELHSFSDAPPGSVLAELWEEGYRFNFFQAVRILERAGSDRAAVGRDAAPHLEVVRFEAHPSLAFPASQIYDASPPAPDEDRPARLIVTFFGMFGPLGALPQHYTGMIIDRLAHKDRVLLDFLNLFNHRLLSHFYRAWEKYQFWISAERALHRERQAEQFSSERLRSFVLEDRPRLDPIGQVLLSLTGLGDPATRYRLRTSESLDPRSQISDQTWRFYAGHFSQRRRCAVGLEQILEHHFGEQVRLQSLCGRWLPLEPSDRTRLVPQGNTQLGRETVIGSKVWEVQGKFRLRIGPLRYADFCHFLPIGTAHQPLGELTRFYVGMQFDFDIELQLLKEEVPPLQCGDSTGIGPRLGWNTWLKTRGFPGKTVSVVIPVREMTSPPADSAA